MEPTAGTPDGWSVQLCFEYTRAEFEEVVRLLSLRSRSFRLNVVAGLVFLAMGMRFHSTVLILLALALLALEVLPLLYEPARQWRRTTGMHGEQRYTVDGRGVTWATPLSVSTMSWKVYDALVEEDRFFLFRAGGKIHHPIPKRVLGDGDADRLRALAALFLPPAR